MPTPSKPKQPRRKARPRRNSRAGQAEQPPRIPEGRQRCAAITAKGKRCRRLAADGADHCAVHLGAPVGRPIQLDEQATERIIAVLAAGGYAETAAAAAGVSRRTFFDWLDRGDPDGTAEADAPFREFRAKVERARAEGESRNVALIARAAAKDWKAAAWMLERQFPDRWAGPRGRQPRGLADPDAPEEIAEGALAVLDDQVGPDGRPL
jgi:hypothetical protein